jgi:hypothetical protein
MQWYLGLTQQLKNQLSNATNACLIAPLRRMMTAFPLRMGNK